MATSSNMSQTNACSSKKTEKICKVCSKIVQHYAGKTDYCSRECRMSVPVGTCVSCGDYTQLFGEGEKCSNNCDPEALIKICRTCSDVLPKDSDNFFIKRRYCSYDCMEGCPKEICRGCGKAAHLLGNFSTCSNICLNENLVRLVGIDNGGIVDTLTLHY